MSTPDQPAEPDLMARLRHWLVDSGLDTLALAVVATAVLTLLAIYRGTAGTGELAAFIALWLPMTTLAFVPVGFIVIPAATALMMRIPAIRPWHIAVVGAVAGAVVPVMLGFMLRLRVVTDNPAVTTLFIVAGALAGLAGGFIHGVLADRRRRRAAALAADAAAAQKARAALEATEKLIRPRPPAG